MNAAKNLFRARPVGLFVSCLSLMLPASVLAQAGESFALVANEENTRDMTVSLVSDTLRDDRIDENGLYDPVVFAGSIIRAPGLAVTKEFAINMVNHDSGILDVQHTLLSSAPMSARTLIAFDTLKQELQEHCWDASDAPQLQAKLRLYIIPPYGPDKHNRLFGVTPSTHFPPTVDIDPPPASMPVAVYMQQEPWVEGNGQNSFFTATTDPAHLLDVVRVGVAGPNTVWDGVEVPAVNVCLNRQPGRVVQGREGRQAELCYDADPNWAPWVEWDVTAAVRKWMAQGFDPATYHGFSLYQSPADTAKDQIRLSPEEPARSRTRAVLSFASSSAKADCAAVGGLFGGPSQSEVIFGNSFCQSAEPGDTQKMQLLPGREPVDIPRILDMKERPEWRPQLVITATGPSRSCTARAALLPERPDLKAGGVSPVTMQFTPVKAGDTLEVKGVSFTASPGITVQRLSAGCQGAKLANKQACTEQLAARAETVGAGSITMTVRYKLDDPNQPEQTLTKTQEITVSEDYDGTPDEIENMGPGQDANQDGVPDRQQSHVNTAQHKRGGWISVATERGKMISDIEFPDVSVDVKEAAVDFQRGFIGFKIKGVGKGQSARVQIIAQTPYEKHDSFWGYGPTPDNFTPHIFKFENRGFVGSKPQDGRFEFLFHDGALGDVDGVQNGEIVVLGGIGRAVGDTDKEFRLTDATVASADGLLALLLGGMLAGGGCLRLRARARKEDEA